VPEDKIKVLKGSPFTEATGRITLVGEPKQSEYNRLTYYQQFKTTVGGTISWQVNWTYDGNGHIGYQMQLSTVFSSLHLIAPFFCLMFALSLAPATAAAEIAAFCAGADVKLDVPFTGLPVKLHGHMVSSSIDTMGLLVLNNVSDRAISDVNIQVEYKGVDDRTVGLLWYGGTTSDRPHSYFVKLKSNLAPNESITLHATSLSVFTECPRKARLTAIYTRFSSGAEFSRAVSGWTFEASPRKIAEPHFPSGSLPEGDSAYILQLNIDSSGEVREVRQLKSANGPLPSALEKEIRKWRFHPETLDGKPRQCEILAVLRILKSNPDIQKTAIPFAPKELSPAFVLINLPLRTSSDRPRTGHEDFVVFFGSTQFSGTSEIVW